MPRRDYREFPEEVAGPLREAAQTRAVWYAAVEDASDDCQRVVDAVESDDAIVIELADDEPSLVNHVGELLALISERDVTGS